ncbi:hypothetical protein GE21DRAFT_1381 [Neurospora crassa]|uniref:Elongin-A n=1 Tax=Neurospora crassa (strain ATCC 24698 / 74-OR23-1A / CBS 708.71 / DSM 1257 / FGSC 987) TaxID=367110 RepID=Q7SEN6_NEUCR|nr:hypothetical protein NCU03308 [Neurospora crassa OR74A]EAA35249.1 hypothetical protein NCU03308 [Neurospora crassa OR74A]KHE81056.1 hypothetical protein GE21DRAFT_1381 [Neurospora crassa]|eukprot:XP_964485.1 hypothetical protein NCU03308 [Neurospora crassa OR74A]
MPGPRSLLDMALKLAIDNAQDITCLDDVPPRIASQILKAVRTPEHLRTIEIHSGDEIYELTAESWRRFIERKYGLLHNKHRWEPSNPKSWHKVYEKYGKLQKESDELATEALRAKMAAVNDQKSSRTTTIVSAQVARKLPAPKARTFGPGFRGFSTSSDPPMKRATFLQKATREAKLDAHRRKLAKPSVMLMARKTELTRAPDRLIEEKRIQNQFDIDSAPIIEGPRIRPATSSRQQKDREARLLQIKNGGKSGSSGHAPNVLSFDDDDNDHHYDNSRHNDKGASGDDMDDLFGDLDDEDARSPPPKSKRGLLSASPGANSQPRAAAASARPTTTSRPPPTSTTNAGRSSNTGRSQPATSSSSGRRPESLPGAKRKQVDIFMKPAKKVRRV